MASRSCRGSSPALTPCTFAALAALAIGCGTTPAPDPAAPVASAPAAATAATASAAPETTAVKVASAPAAKVGVPADSSPPTGTSPLAEAEKNELSSKCKKLIDGIADTARKDGHKKRPIDYVTATLAAPPKITGVDVPRCSELLLRDTVAYLAGSRESEAKQNLKRIVVGLMTALERQPPAFCASAPAVPASLDAVKDKPYTSTNADWSGDGWKCARFELVGGPQVFQYELRTDAKASSYEVIARGYPVQGGPPTELYIAGKVENGAVDPSSPILRR